MQATELYVDMDGVLADFIGGVCRQIGIRAENVLQSWRRGEWNDICRLAGISESELWKKYCGSRKFWQTLNRCDGFDEVVDLADDICPGWKIATHVAPVAVGCAGGKSSWIEANLGTDREYFICCDKSSLSAPGRVLLDDCDANVDAWRQAGGLAVLYPRPWNSAYARDPGDALQELCGIFRMEERQLYVKDLQEDRKKLDESYRSNGKPSNPKDSLGVRKAPMSVLPINVVLEAAVGMYEGARKYGRYNWRDVGVRSSVYYDAAFRHLAAWYEGEDIDPDSGLSHVTKAITSLLVLRDAQMRNMLEDDRPKATGDFGAFLAELNAATEAVYERTPCRK